MSIIDSKTGKIRRDYSEVLSVENLTKKFSGVIVVNNVNFSLLEGEIHGLVGENGAGKSTFVRMLDGSFFPNDGKIILKGEEMKFHSPLEAFRKGIGMVYQELMLLPKQSIAENICISKILLENKKVINWQKINEIAYNKLKELGLDYDVRVKVNKISVAEQQLVALARVLINNCKVVILDESTSALGEKDVKVLFEVMKRLKNMGISIIFISHRLEEILKISDRITIFRDGQKIGTFKTEELSKDKIVTLITGREIKDMYPKVLTKVSDTILKVENMSIENKVDDVSFEVKRGEILYIVGSVGAGKTEIAKALFGVYDEKTLRGNIYFENKKISIHSPKEAIEKIGIALINENRRDEGLFLKLSVRFNISINILKDIIKRGFSINSKEEVKIVEKFIKKLDINCLSVEQKVETLSGGNQQKVILSRWLAKTNIKLIIFDEPTRGIDVGAKVEIYKLMNQLVQEGIGILVFSSEVPEAIAISDRLLVMYRGKIVHEELRSKTGFDEHLIQSLVLSGRRE